MLIAAVACWSLNFTFMKYGVTHGYAPLAFVALRWALASGVFVAICVLVEGSLALARRDLAVLAAAVTCGVLLNQIALAYGLHAAGAVAVALVFGILPIVISVLAGAFRIERIGRRHWIAVAVSCVGVACVAAGTAGSGHGSLRGIGLALAAVVTFAIYAVAVFPLMARWSALRVNAVGSLIGALLLVIASAPSLAAEDWGDVPASAWGALVASALISLVVGNGLWLLALSRVGPARASIFVNLQPFLGALAAAALLSEPLSALSIAGGLLLLVTVLGVVTRAAGVP